MTGRPNVDAWLDGLGLRHLSPLFAANDVDGDLLPNLTADDLKDIGVTRLRERKRLLEAVAALSVSAPAAAAAAERRHLSVVFIDLVGSTGLAESLDPEEMGELLRAFRAAAEQAAGAHGGYVANYFGDGMLVLFGYPAAREDDAAHAVRGALAAVRAVEALGARFADYAPEGLAARSAVASGVVLVGRLDGPSGQRETSVIGETPNLAARLQELAPPGGVAVSDGVRLLVERSFRLRELGVHAIRGFPLPQFVWLAEAEAVQESRFESGRDRELAEFVGRERELEQLMALWREAEAGVGRAVLLSGEAGIGKSRLCHALVQRIAPHGAEIVRLQGSSVRSASALFPLIERLERLARIDPAAPPEARRDRLATWMEKRGATSSEETALVAEVLGLPAAEGTVSADLNPVARRRAALVAIVDRLLAVPQGQTLALVVEDAHWIDPSTLEWLDLVLAAIPDRRVLLVVTRRPSPAPASLNSARVTTLDLAPLGEGEARDLVRRLTVDADLDEAAVAQLVERTDGVPLFIEECVRMKVGSRGDSGVRERRRAATIPATIHDLLLARVDQLGGAKPTAQLAACLGRRFTLEQLEAVMRGDETMLSAHLDAMLRAGVVVAAEEGDPGFVFRHALVQNAAYHSITQETRRALHRRVAQALDGELRGGRAAASPDVLAHHYAEAGNRDAAILWWRRAAGVAMAASAFVEAATHYGRAVALAAEGGDEEAARTELELQIEMAVPLTLTQGWASEAVSAAYRRAQVLGARDGASPFRFPAASGVFNFLLVTGRHAEAEALVDADLERARSTEDASIVLEFELNAGVARHYQGRTREAEPHLRRSVELFDPARHSGNVALYGKSPATVALSHLAKALAILGRPEEAFEMNRRSAEPSAVQGHEFSAVWALSNHTVTCLLYEDYAAAARMAEESIALAARRGFVPWLAQSQVWLGRCLAADGRAEAGLALIEDGMALWERIGLSLMRPFYRVLQAETLESCGRPEAALEAAEAALAEMDVIGEGWARPRAEIRTAVLARRLGRATEAETEAALARVVGAAAAQGARLWALEAELARFALAIEVGRRPDSAALRRAVHGFAGRRREPLLRRAAALLERTEGVAV